MQRIDLFETLKEVIAEQLEIDGDTITEDSSFVDDLGADSLDLLQLITALEDEFEVSIPDEDFEAIKTVGDALDQIVLLEG